MAYARQWGSPIVEPGVGGRDVGKVPEGRVAVIEALSRPRFPRGREASTRRRRLRQGGRGPVRAVVLDGVSRARGSGNFGGCALATFNATGAGLYAFAGGGR